MITKLMPAWRLTALAAALALGACSVNEPSAHYDHGPDNDHATAHADEHEGRDVHADEHQDAHADEHTEEGPQGGRLLTAGEFTVEVTIFERGIPPEYRLYVYKNGNPIDPATVDAEVPLTRLDGETNHFQFTPVGSYLRGDGVVTEPHSFDVEVEATIDGAAYRWAYATHEGRVQLDPALAAAAGVETEVAGPGTIEVTRTLYGHIEPDPARVAHIRARFPGLITAMKVSVGDRVKRGQALLTVEANDSLQRYTVRSLIAGVVVSRRASRGEVASDEPLLTIADYSTVWAQLAVFPSDAGHVRVGQTVNLHGNDIRATGTIAWIAPMGEHGPAREARVVLDNANGRWPPGTAVRADVVVDSVNAPLVVQNTGLQAFRDFTVVFAKVGNTYEVRMLDLGRSDGRVTEVLGGLKPGTEYVTANSYLIKADSEKSGASHDH